MKKNPRQKQLKVFAIGLPLLLLFFSWRHYSKVGLDYWVIGCLTLAVLSVFFSILSKDIFEGFFDCWMKVAALIGLCVTTILLAIIYYGVFTPVAFILRLNGKDFMSKRLNTKAPTYWIKCQEGIKNKDTYLQQF